MLLQHNCDSGVLLLAQAGNLPHLLFPLCTS